MKKSFLLVLSVFVVFSFACTKDCSQQPAQQLPVIDLLTGKNWKISVLTFVQDNTLYYYKRGASGNVFNFSNDTYFFKKDGTGTYTAQNNNAFSLTWQFVDSEKKTIEFTLLNYNKALPAPGTNQKVRWENVQVKTSTLDYAEIYTESDGKATMSSVRRIIL